MQGNGNKRFILDHIQAQNPCTYTSVLQWARYQGVASGFTQNINALKHEGLITLNDDDGALVIDLTDSGVNA